jgi:hypothetical protein
VRPSRRRKSSTRLWRPGTTERLLREAGFEDVRVGAYRAGRVASGFAVRVSRQFGVAARKPGEETGA